MGKKLLVEFRILTYCIEQYPVAICDLMEHATSVRSRIQLDSILIYNRTRTVRPTEEIRLIGGKNMNLSFNIFLLIS
jgi:hypothetical protein